MFHLHEKLKYFLYPAAVDMRKSFYSLSGIVTSIMKRDIQRGEVLKNGLLLTTQRPYPEGG